MSHLGKFKHYVIAGASAVGGALVSYYIFHSENKKHAYASWTTNFTPSEKWDTNWDRMEPQSLVKPSSGTVDDNRFNEEVQKVKPKATRHILLIRHGQYNLDGTRDSERTLTELGKQQAVRTGERLKELALPYTKLVRSTMTRATQTAQYIEQALEKELPVNDCCMLQEGAPIPPEPPVGHWKPEFHQFYQDGARIEAAFRKYFHRAPASQKEDSYEILVCHANVIRYFVCRALQFPPEAWLRIGLKHASITWVSVLPSGRVTLHALGDTGHLPPKLISSM
ncbi:hypothetical protein R5R35_007574 [Gryllus longicercus]|uniref:Serine/threonine-protein phosphatase PGAM5, mitochondrial n=1 Tax=Gryllus longicercus TaxID=2509291 RepID=A0AAN9WCZ0_9ORTH